MSEAAIVSVAATVIGSGAFIALVYYVGRKNGRISVLKETAESQVDARRESDRDKDEIVKLSKSSLRDRGSKWVRPND